MSVPSLSPQKIQFKGQLKIKGIQGFPSSFSSSPVSVQSIWEGEQGKSSLVIVENGNVSWAENNLLAKIGKIAEPLSILVLNNKDSAIGECDLDLLEYVTKVKPGTTKKFKINKNISIKDGTISLCLSLAIIRKEETDQTEEPNVLNKISRDSKRKVKSSKTKTDTLTTEKSKLSGSSRRTARKNKSSESLKELEIPKTRHADSSPSLTGKGTEQTTNLSDLFSKKNSEEDVVSLKGSHYAHRLLSESFSTGSRSSANSRLSSSLKQKPKQSNNTIDELSSDFISPRVSGTRLVQRPSPFQRKYSTLPTSQLKEDEQSPRGLTSGKYTTLRMSKSAEKKRNTDAKNTDAASLKLKYAEEKQEADEKFLIENVISSEVSSHFGDKYVMPYIVFQSLSNWGALSDDDETQARIINACKLAIKKYEDSRTMLFHWLSSASALLYMAKEKKIKWLKKGRDHEELLDVFIEETQDLISFTFELAIQSFLTRVKPMESFIEAIEAPPEKIHEDNAGLSHLFSVLSDYSKYLTDHCIIYEIKKHFYKRIYHYLAASLLDALVQDGSTYAQGLQMKMLVTKLEQWTHTKIGPENSSLVACELMPAREAANVICLPRKVELEQEALRKTVCPSLRPAHIQHLLKGYRADQFDNELAPQSLLDKLNELDAEFVPEEGKTFDPKEKTPLIFNFEIPTLDLKIMTLPKEILDRPGFAFLKKKHIDNNSRNENNGEKW